MTIHSRFNSPGHFAFDLSLFAYRSAQRSGFHMNLLKITLCHNKAFTILLHPPAQKTTLSSAHNKKASFEYDSIGLDRPHWFASSYRHCGVLSGRLRIFR